MRRCNNYSTLSTGKYQLYQKIWTSLEPLLDCTFNDFSQLNQPLCHHFKFQLLIFIRLGLLNLNFYAGFNTLLENMGSQIVQLKTISNDSPFKLSRQ